MLKLYFLQAICHNANISIRPCYSYGGTEPYKKSSLCSGRRKKIKGQGETKMGRWCDGRCQEVGGQKLEEYSTTRNRDSWQKLLKKALAQKGLLCQ